MDKPKEKGNGIRNKACRTSRAFNDRGAIRGPEGHEDNGMKLYGGEYA